MSSTPASAKPSISSGILVWRADLPLPAGLPTALEFTVYVDPANDLKRLGIGDGSPICGRYGLYRSKGRSPQQIIPFEYDGQNANGVIGWIAKSAVKQRPGRHDGGSDERLHAVGRIEIYQFAPTKERAHMPGHLEIETKQLQEKISELQGEHAKLEDERKRVKWLDYVGLSTALLAVIGVVAALQATSLINEGLVSQIKATDTWAEFQASREKEQLYAVALNGMVDAEGAFPPQVLAARAKAYRTKIAEETGKELEREAAARGLEVESAAQLYKQHFFEYSVALIQVAIALSAIAALSKVKPVWYLGLLAGAGGVALFCTGFFA